MNFRNALAVVVAAGWLITLPLVAVAVDPTGTNTVNVITQTIALVGIGPKPTLTGSCTNVGTQIGGNTAGSFIATCAGQTVIITFSTTAPNGWACFANDVTTTTDTMRQSATSATSCTLTGTTVASDVINFHAVAY